MLGKALQGLPRLCSLPLDYHPLYGDLTGKLPPKAALPEPLHLLVSARCSLGSHRGLPGGLLSPSALGAPPSARLPCLIYTSQLSKQPGTIAAPPTHCSRDVALFHVAQAERTGSSRQGHQPQETGGDRGSRLLAPKEVYFRVGQSSLTMHCPQ